MLNVPENPAECPNCEFEPDEPDARAIDIPDDLREQRAELLGERSNLVWQQTTTNATDGSYTIALECPECGETVAEHSGEGSGGIAVPDGFLSGSGDE